MPNFLAGEQTDQRLDFLAEVIQSGCEEAKVWAAGSECLTRDDVQDLLQASKSLALRKALIDNPVVSTLLSAKELYELTAGKTDLLQKVEKRIAGLDVTDRRKRDLIAGF